MEKLVQYFLTQHFAAEEVKRIAASFSPQKLNRGEFFVVENKISTKLAFLEEGLLQYFSIDAKGDERTTYISMPNTFVASLLSFLHEIPARENIRAISNTVLWTIKKPDFIRLKNEIPAFKNFYIGLLEWQVCCIDSAKFDLITLSAEARYEKLLLEEPEVLKHVPLQYIASMLGITPRHLSRLRGKT